MLTPNLSDIIDLDSTFQELSNDMLHARVLTNSLISLPCPHFFHGNGIFPTLSNMDFFHLTSHAREYVPGSFNVYGRGNEGVRWGYITS